MLLFGTFKAVQTRGNYQHLIAWGAVADAGLMCMGLGAENAIGVLGALLFACFQLFSRGLAYAALQALTPAHAEPTAEALRSAGVGCGKAGITGKLFALGLLAALGGSPFLVPEGRMFIMQGIVTGGLLGGIAGPVLAALCGTVFVWLSVEAVCRVCLLDADSVNADNDSEADADKYARSEGKLEPAVLILGAIVALMGIGRGLMTFVFADMAGASALVSHPAGAHPAYYVLYYGALVVVCLGWYRPAFRDKAAVAITGFSFLLAVGAGEMAAVSRLFAVLVTGVGFVVSVYSMGYMAHAKRVTAYQCFLMLTFASLVGIVTSTDLGAFYGYWELMTFASYFLVVHEGNRVAFAAGSKYYIMCAGGAFLMLPGLMMLGAGSTSMADIPAAAVAMDGTLLKAALVLTLAGFAVKAGLVPLHGWLPDAHPAAPSSVSGPLSGVITKMGIFGIVVVILGQAGYAAQNMPGQAGLSWIGYAISFMGGLTLILGEYMALKQDDIKRMLAYSTLGQLGEITLILGLGTWLATVGALAHTVNHAIMKDLLFLGAGALIMRAGSRQLADLKGLWRDMPWTVGCMVVGLISIMGLPPFAGFFSKYLMIQAAVDAGYMPLAVLILAGSLVGAVYYTRILRVIVFEKRPEHLPKVQEAPWSIRIALLMLASLCILLGLAPQLSLMLIVPVASAGFVPQGNAALILASVNVPWPVFVAVPMLGAFVPMIFRNNPKKAGWSAVWVLLLTAALVLIFGRYLDTLSYLFALLVPLVGALNMAYAVGYMDHSHTQWRFYGAFCCMCAGLIGIASSEYLFSFFLFWEIMSSWALYMALAHEGDRDSMREAFKYFLFNVFGAGFIFVGVTVLGAYTPLNVTILWQAVPNLPTWAATVGVSLLAIGFVMKAAQLPFRIDWQMHPALAPTPVSGFISSVLLKSAIFGLIKLFMLLGGALVMANILEMEHQRFIQLIVMWIGGITIIMASIQALMSSNLKLVFIYSTVSQIGYMVLAVGIGSALGYAGGLLHLINHVFFKDLLFLVCGAIMFQTHKDNLADLGGIGRKMPFTLTMFAIAGLSVVGVPPTSGFTSKWIIYHALMADGQPMLALMSLIGSVITLAYIAKFLHAAFLGQPSADLDHVTEVPRSMRVPMGILGAGCIITGVFPGLALYPINGILGEYGMRGLDVAISGINSGTGAWNATAMAVMVALASYAGWKFVTHFVDANSRLTDVHTCGLEPDVASSRMGPANIYAGLMGLLTRRTPKDEGDMSDAGITGTVGTAGHGPVNEAKES